MRLARQAHRAGLLKRWRPTKWAHCTGWLKRWRFAKQASHARWPKKWKPTGQLGKTSLQDQLSQLFSLRLSWYLFLLSLFPRFGRIHIAPTFIVVVLVCRSPCIGLQVHKVYHLPPKTLVRSQSDEVLSGISSNSTWISVFHCQFLRNDVSINVGRCPCVSMDDSVLWCSSRPQYRMDTSLIAGSAQQAFNLLLNEIYSKTGMVN